MKPEELTKIAPTLAKIERKEVFVVPELYFEALPEAMKQLTLQGKEQVFAVPENYFEHLPLHMQQLVLAEKKENTFEVPENYFELLPHIIQAKAHEKRRIAGFDWQFQPKVKLSLAMVTACTLAFVAYTFLFQSNSVNTQTAVLTEVQPELSFDEQVMMNVDESTLIEALEPATEAAPEEENEISNYLLENNVDINSIINEL